MRLLVIDGSQIMLPDTADVSKEFGHISYTGKKAEVQGAHADGLASVMYDVLNRIVVDSVLGKARAYEVNLACEHLEPIRRWGIEAKMRHFEAGFSVF